MRIIPGSSMPGNMEVPRFLAPAFRLAFTTLLRSAPDKPPADEACETQQTAKQPTLAQCTGVWEPGILPTDTCRKNTRFLQHSRLCVLEQSRDGPGEPLGEGTDSVHFVYNDNRGTATTRRSPIGGA
ncbi:hypothetical protein CSUB01_00942 [Colletotrichum sublineola]|uniref:Uncharacterized protein n=1 Tax=Colletotrichum sublineola TaxID=1173701 RepID=A0A066XC13_COLSU|nr:hypothetical protein CSUB01_00942 [Colletotrichum sublineola]